MFWLYLKKLFEIVKTKHEPEIPINKDSDGENQI